VVKDYIGVPGMIRIVEARNVNSVKAAPLLSTVTYATLIPESIYGDVKSLANYVLSRAEYDHGYKWATKMDSKIFYNTVLQNGAAGVGFFLLLLYNMTNNVTFFDYARGAANWIMVNAESRNGGLAWPHYDLQTGWYLTPDKSIAGIAKFLLKMYKTTGDKKYLEYAEGATRWIINTGIKCQGDRCYVEYNPYHQAAFGVYSYPQRDVGTLLIELYTITKDQTYLDYAKKIGNWILGTSECYGNYCKWYDDRGYGNLYTVEGIAVLADYLYDLYSVTSIVQYRDIADKMVNWIESIGVKVSADSIKFPSWDKKFRSIVWGDWDRLLSIRTPGEIFIRSYEATENRSRLAVAKMFANWLESISVETGRVSTGSFMRISRATPYIEGEKSYSPWVNVIIFNFLVKLYSIERDQKYIDLATSLLNYIEDYMKENLQKLDPIFYQGASGIGYHLASALLAISITPIESTIIVADTVPFDRLFTINMRIKNPGSSTITVKVVLEERTGFQAGSVYGDGDEVKLLTLNPGEESELSFKARVYGIPRVGDVARFRFYIGDQLVDQKDQFLNLKPEFAEVLSFTSPATVKKGSSFKIGVPVFYSFSTDTTLALILTNEETGKNLMVTDVVKGEGLKIYSLTINSGFVNLESEGVRSFRFTVQVEYPEESNRVAYKKEFSFKVRVSNNVGSSSILLDPGFIIALNYEGKQYFALYAYNATDVPLPQSGKIEDIFRWAYSRRNWLVFEAVNGNFRPVMDDKLYKALAFASEIAYLRATMWNEDYLLTRSSYFRELSQLASQAEALNFLAEFTGKLAGIIGLQAASAWASSVSSGIESDSKLYDIIMRIDRIIEIFKKLDLYSDSLKAVQKANQIGGGIETAPIWLSIIFMNSGATDLEKANKLLTHIPLSNPPFIMNVNVSEALEFYDLVENGETKGLAGMHFLSAYYAKDQLKVMGVNINIRAFKNAFLEALGFIGDAYSFYEALRGGFGIPEVYEFIQHIVTVHDEYEMRREICQSASLDFRNTYIRETANSMDITLVEPERQHKLYLTIYDERGRILGFNKATGTIEAGILGSYYIDFGNAIKVHIPLDVKIDKIIVDASKATQPIENYTLRVEIYKDGKPIETTSVSNQIAPNEQKAYNFQLTKDLKPLLNETTILTTPQTPPMATGILVLVIILASIIALTLFVIVWKRK
jgi:rhamnogalacturonyl hydrolase YesR